MPPRDVSAILAGIIKDGKTPGMVAAIVESDGGTRIVATGAAGVRRRGSDEKVTIDDKFHLGSCTKAMTATLCALLVEEHKLDWDRTLADYLPELKETMQPGYALVTLKDLLHHRAGIPDDLAQNGVWAAMWKFQGSARQARDKLLPEVLKLPPVGTPGQSYRYANAGYAIAGWLCERAAGKDYEDLLRERVWKPLGITSGGFGPPGSRDTLDQPRGHDASGKPIEPGQNADNPRAIAPAGTAHMSIADWARFAGLHLAGARAHALTKPDPRLLLSDESFALLHATVEGATEKGQDYAMGWIVGKRPWADGPVLTHAGSNTMWFCVAWIAPKKDFAVLVACNAADPATQRAAEKAVGELIQDEASHAKR